ncbi:MAG: long-chain fatty acid--CoA ligase [Gammaproteobacteria bacterium]|nr:long-chain fatty acid--CoA ligase [Gammaproteobacteria bacterium]
MVSSGLHQLSAAVLGRAQDDHAIEFEKHWYTWGDLRRVASLVTELIAESGAAANAKVVLVAKNRPSAIAAYLGLMEKRYSFRLVYPFQSSTAMAREIELIKPAVVIAAEETFDNEMVAALASNGIAAIALSQKDAVLVAGLERSTIDAAISDTPIIEIHTSGTTGAPKPFEFSYETIATHIVGGRPTPSSAGANPQLLPPVLMYFPAGNITGLHSTIAPLLRGQRGVLLDRFSVEGWHDHLKRFRPAAGGLPPSGVQTILDADLPREDFASLKMIGTGSAPLDPAVHKAFEERYGVPILLAYGATEFGGPVTSMTPEIYAVWGEKKLGSVGKPFPGAHVRVIDPDTNAVLPAGTMGVLEVVSPRMGPEWIRTSDIAYLDEDGFLFLCGRADGAIMRGGFKVLPETIEKALLQHPAISAAGVIGVTDHRLGQVPAAAIQLKAGVKEPTFADLEQHLRQLLAATHIPVKWKYVNELPRTASYKVHLPTLRKLFE